MPSSEKRQFSGASVNTNAKVNGHNSAGQKIKNFFRINSSNKNDVSQANSESGSQKDGHHDAGARTPQ
ncbi:hypothetical protein KC352_g45935, partial [Hortaea werneckii]